MRRSLILIFVACVALAIAGCGGGSDSSSSTSGNSGGESGGAQSGAEAAARTKPTVEVPKKPAPTQMIEKEIITGTGPEAKSGDQVTVQYVGVLYKNGKQFDASWDRGEPFTFKLGSGEVITGWEVGIEKMKEGGRRELIIPPELAYGSQSNGTIPANSTLIFVIDLLKVKK